MYCYAVNGRCTSPGHLWLTGCRGGMENQLQRLQGFDKWIIEKESQSYIDALQDQKENLVYLTADSETVLDELDLKKIYIIGRLVDRNRWKGITMKKANEQGIQTAKLPTGSYLKMSSSEQAILISLQWPALLTNSILIDNVEKNEEIKNHDEKKIDIEIEEIEKEIKRLSSRLEVLRLEKAERNLSKTIEKRGRVVAAKFMEQKQSVKIEEPMVSSAQYKINRRGVSLGPNEILSGSKSRLLFGKQGMKTPVSTQNRRKSCFWKLEEIDELKATKERRKSLSVSLELKYPVQHGITKQSITI